MNETDRASRVKGRPIRTVFLTSSMQIGGQEQYIAQQMVNMDRSRFDLTLCCLKDSGPMAEAVRAAGIPVASGFQHFKYDLISLFRLANYLRSRKPDILYIFDFRNVLFIGRLAGKLAGVRVIVIASHKMNVNNSGRSYKWLDLQLMPLSDHVIAAAEAHRKSLIANDRISPDTITAIHNGIQISRLELDLKHAVTRAELGVPTEGRIVGTVARLSAEKSQTVLLEAASLIIRAAPATHFVFVGDGPERRNLEARAVGLGICDRVHFLGFRKRVAPIVRLFDVFTLSSTSTELFSAATLEAMALCVPTVVTDIGGMREMVIHGVTGFLVPPNDPKALAEMILYLLKNPEASREMGVAGRMRVEELFTAEQEAVRIQALFERLMSAKANQ